jgi:hypothetical protein
MELENATFYQGQPGTAAATLATVPEGYDWIIDNVVYCNTDTAAACTLTVNLVPAGGTAAAANELIGALSIAESTTGSLAASLGPLGIVLPEGATINALQGTASKVTVFITGRTRRH